MSDNPGVNLALIVAQQTQLLAEMGAVRGDIDKLRTTMGGWMERVEDKLTAIRDDIAVNFGTADTAKKANDNTRDEVRSLSDLVSTMVRKMRTLETRIDTLENGHG